MGFDFETPFHNPKGEPTPWKTEVKTMGQCGSYVRVRIVDHPVDEFDVRLDELGGELHGSLANRRRRGGCPSIAYSLQKRCGHATRTVNSFEKTSELSNMLITSRPIEESKENIVTNMNRVTRTAKKIDGNISQVIPDIIDVEESKGIYTHGMVVDGAEPLRRPP